jgi:glycine/D-amino acid oxidase-like deaminating enzyme
MKRVWARSVPQDDDRCGWLDGLSQPPPGIPLRGAQRADFVVIGAGFTGLAAARRLAEVAPGSRVILLEAQRAGYGASGRSSGFVVEHAGFVAAMKPAEAARFLTLSRLGIAALKTQVETHRIACDWDERGWVHGARGRRGLAALEGLTGWLEDLGAAFQALGPGDLEAITGSGFYRAGVRLPGSVLVHSGALVCGLAAHLPSAVELFEGSPVLEMRHRKASWSVSTPLGEVTAPRLLLAVNGALPAFGVLRRRLFPLYTFGSLTAPLTEREQASLGDESEWGLLAQDPMGTSVRRTRDQRLLIRNTVWYSPRLRVPPQRLDQAREEHRQLLRARFPQLSQVSFPHTWAGLMGMAGNLRHYFGCLGEGLYAAGGYHGAGIAFGTIAGALLADLAAGKESPELAQMLALPGPRWIPPEPFLGWGVRLRLARDRWRAGDAL